MTAHVRTVALQGIQPLMIDVQVQATQGLPAFHIVGLPDKAVTESRERVRGALTALGLSLPLRRIIVNLSPADVVKEGSHYDVPIALGLLTLMDIISQEDVEGVLALGELGLDAHLASVPGVLPASVTAESQNLSLVCPSLCTDEAVWGGCQHIIAPTTLLELVQHLKGETCVAIPSFNTSTIGTSPPLCDLRHVKGHETTKRVLEIVAAGRHNLLMVGAPGIGKSMLASCLPALLPPMEAREILETEMIRSVSRVSVQERFSRSRPFRSPHHSTSIAALIGGGRYAAPGEISLSHNGILFLDELAEFEKRALESLRQPMETGSVTIARAHAHITYPSRFQLVGAMNPCRCGYLGDPSRSCSRVPECGRLYQSKLSGPLLDRIDCYIDVPEISPSDLKSTNTPESTEEVLQRVARAYGMQQERYAGDKESSNAQVPGNLLEQKAGLGTKERDFLLEAMTEFQLSVRGYYRTLRVARTIADLDLTPHIRQDHLAEALSYRHRPLAPA